MGVLSVALATIAAPASAADPHNEPTTASAPEAALAQLFDRMEAVDRQLPRDTFDPQAIIETVGRDPQKLFDWVRDNTALLPYRGALRGSAGVLMDRGGSSLDRALLLAELVESAGSEVRLANATLTKEQAGQLLDRVTRARLSSAPGEPADEVRQARDRVRRQADQIVKALGDLPPGEPAPPAHAIDALTDHWWVQRHEATGKWVDLDVDGVSIGTPGRTIPFTARTARLPLDPRDFHEVQLRVVIEAWQGGRLNTQTVLGQAFRPLETLGRSISFTHFAGKGVGGVIDAKEANAAAIKRIKDALAKQEVFVPTLLVDGRPITEASFTTAGEVDRNPTVDPSGVLAKSAGHTTANMAGLLGGGGGGGGAAKPAEGVLTAEWIEYEVRVPGSPPQVARREVFDLIGPAARAAGVKAAPAVSDDERLRRALRLAGRTHILIQPCDLSASFLVHRSVRADLRERDLWLAISAGGEAARAKFRAAAGKFLGRDNLTPAFALARGSLAAAAATRTFIDRPNIVQYWVWLEASDDGGLAQRRGVDLAVTSSAAVSVGAEGFRARLEQGVADTLSESLALGPDAVPSENTVTAFESVAGHSAALSVVKPAAGAAAALAALNLPPDTMARAKADLAAGNVLVLVPAVGSRWAWWRVDPRTGQSVGVMDDGFNSAMTERQQLDRDIALYAEDLNAPITRKSLEQASKDQLWQWAKNHPNAQRMFWDLEQMQSEAIGQKIQAMVRLL